jgi:penicillin-binding protein 2
MKFVRPFAISFLLVFLSACGLAGIAGGTPTLPPPGVTTVPSPSVETAMRSYLDAMLVEDYNSMYAMLNQASQDRLGEEEFANRYLNDLDAMSLSKMDYTILSTLTDPAAAQVNFRITYHTALFGDLSRENFIANFNLEGGQWRLDWHDSLILPELADGSTLQSDPIPPARGDIYDRNGDALVTQADAVAVGLVAGQVPPDKQDAMFNDLWRLTGVRPEMFGGEYGSYPAGQYVPVGEASQADYNNHVGFLGAFSAMQATPYSSRFAALASQAVGYTQAIFPEEVHAYRRLGYSLGQRVGRTGIEKWGESYLAGKNAATLYVVDAAGKVGATIASTDRQPADSVYLTIDKNLQAQAQQAMDGLPGAIVVLERDTGRVLAMVSSPGLDANLFDPNNPNKINLTIALGDPNNPLLNRATQGKYPLGSVFKIVTMAAALESGVFTPDSTWECAYDYTELVSLGGPTLYDWTYTHCQDAKAADPNATCNTINTKPSGLLTLPQGLKRSCDPWFYHIGFTLFTQDNGKYRTAISDMARAFGLGKPTGIGFEEEAGNIPPEPSDATNATSLAIGQGGVLVTPLQVADFIAAVGNGGTLYKPQLVEKIVPVSGDPLAVFKPQAMGTLPVTAEHLLVIQQAMRSVANDPLGTAYSVLGTFPVPTAAKTGTAESGTASPHAWFAGYSLANRPDKPDIAVVVVVNNQGEGAQWALPIFRRVMELYFYGQPQYIYRWESNVGVIRPTETPIPTNP